MNVRTRSRGHQVITTDGESKLIHDRYWDSWNSDGDSGKFYLIKGETRIIIFSGEPNDADYNKIMSLNVGMDILTLMRSMSIYLDDPPGYHELAKKQVEQWINTWGLGSALPEDR